jgi:hypothetical protein
MILKKGFYKMTSKKPVIRIKKYTIERTQEDINNINKIRKYLELNNNGYNKSFKSDSKIYRELPVLFLNAVKRIDQLQLAIDELTAKMEDLEDLRSCFCRINTILGTKDKEKK